MPAGRGTVRRSGRLRVRTAASTRAAPVRCRPPEVSSPGPTRMAGRPWCGPRSRPHGQDRSSANRSTETSANCPGDSPAACDARPAHDRRGHAPTRAHLTPTGSAAEACRHWGVFLGLSPGRGSARVGESLGLRGLRFFPGARGAFAVRARAPHPHRSTRMTAVSSPICAVEAVNRRTNTPPGPYAGPGRLRPHPRAIRRVGPEAWCARPRRTSGGKPGTARCWGVLSQGGRSQE